MKVNSWCKIKSVLMICMRNMIKINGGYLNILQPLEVLSYLESTTLN